jgi:hypothetical protein
MYTEKRSEALSQAVFATSDSIEAARIDLAEKYSKEAQKLAYPPKKRIEILPIITADTIKHEIKNEAVKINKSPNPQEKISSSIVTAVEKVNGKTEQQTVLRLVVPERLKHAKLLIENSEEWQELVKSKNFAERLKKDYDALKKLQEEIDKELQRQNEMNNKMVQQLNEMQKQLIKKDLAILKRNIIIVILLAAIAGGVYLRMKGVL